MKIKTIVCNDCGHEEKIPIYSIEEAKREHLQLIAPRCKRCGSLKVKLYT